MKYIEIILAWNEIADMSNQWSSLGEDEKIEFAFSLGRTKGIAESMDVEIDKSYEHDQY
jgi:hypothetical protein